MFAHVYSDPHPLMQEQAAWLAAYEAAFPTDEPTPPTVEVTPTTADLEPATSADGGDA
jgi:hypothetical protein